jgi:hypothetical protein
MGAIDTLLSDKERQVLEAYKDPRRGFKQTIKLSTQYAVGMALFVYLAIYDDALWSLAAYGVFLAWLVARLIGARKIAGVMPGIIEKYERRILELERGES